MMKRLLAGIAVVMLLTLSAGRATAAPDVYDRSQAHPLRIAAYLAYPIGFAAEWLIFRPFHSLVSSYPDVFGHHPHSENKLES